MSLVWSREEFNEESRLLISALQKVGQEESTDTMSRFLMDWSLEAEETNATSTISSGGNLYWKHPPIIRDVQLDDKEHNDIATEEDEEEDRLCDDTIFQDDPEVLLSSTPSTTTGNTTATTTATKWYFSIVYSDTWKAPILYFTVDYDNDNDNGSPCPRSDVVQMLMTFSHYNRVDDAWEFLSHEEHPVSRFPSFFLHSCQTMERLQTLQSADYIDGSPPLLLLSWMALIFPSVGYSIPSKIFQELKMHCRNTAK